MALAYYCAVLRLFDRFPAAGNASGGKSVGLTDCCLDQRRRRLLAISTESVGFLVSGSFEQDLECLELAQI